MHIVDSLFGGPEYQTTVSISKKASKTLDKFAKKNQQVVGYLLKKLKFYAEKGFQLYEGEGKPIRHEWDGVLRIGETSSLLRLLGFYEHEDKSSFLIIDAYRKHGQRLSSDDRERIDRVASVRRNRLWTKGSAR